MPVNDELIIISHPLQAIVKRFIENVKGAEGATVVFIGLSVLVGSYVAIDLIIRFFATWVAIPSWLLLIILSFLAGSSGQIFLYFFWKQRLKLVEKNMTPSLKILLNDVERYNSVIKAIDINDQIEAAGNPGVSLKERQKVLEALALTRSDLVRALRTEKILRENKKFIISRSELFANNLATLTAMQVSEQASEHGRLLNEALQIALDVQHEMKSLQSQG
nr:hypothetical protein [Scytonema sp. UIC 10036]